MKEEVVNFDEEGFEEIVPKNKGKQEQPATQPTGETQKTGNRPDFSVVQADRDKDGKSVYTNVGGMWKNISKNGKEFYTLKIGQLKLLVFQNNKQ